MEKTKTVDEVKLNNVNGGSTYEFRMKYYCNGCGAQFNQKRNDSCPYCHGKDVVLRD